MIRGKVPAILESGLQFGVPIKEINPAYVQVIRGKLSSGVEQLHHRRLDWLPPQRQIALAWKAVALGQVAGCTCRHNIGPNRLPSP